MNYSFKEWHKGNVIRFYINPAPATSYLTLSSRGKVSLESPDKLFKSTMLAALETHLNIDKRKFGFDELRYALNSLSLPIENSQSLKSNSFERTVLPSTSIAAKNSLNHFANTIKMAGKTLKNVVGAIDTRESAATVAYYAAGAIPCQVQTLAIGDIQFVNEKDKTLIVIERKTVADFYQSIVSTRAHSQAERLYDNALSLRAQGWRVMTCWLIIENDTKTLYDVLPDTKQMDGMLNYLSAILGHFVFRAFNDQHGAYLVNKLVQGFNELKLTYPVKNESGLRVDIPKSAMDIAAAAPSVDERTSHNVNTAQSNQLLYTLTSFTSINMKVAKSLAATGRPLRSILNMTEVELLEIDGIGPKLASKITAEFSI